MIDSTESASAIPILMVLRVKECDAQMTVQIEVSVLRLRRLQIDMGKPTDRIQMLYLRGMQIASQLVFAIRTISVSSPEIVETYRIGSDTTVHFEHAHLEILRGIVMHYTRSNV